MPYVSQDLQVQDHCDIAKSQMNQNIAVYIKLLVYSPNIKRLAFTVAEI